MKLHEKVEGTGSTPRHQGTGGHGGGRPQPRHGNQQAGSKQASSHDRRPGAAAPREFGPKQDAPAANPLAAQLAKLKLKGS
jgi:hypothetical protein